MEHQDRRLLEELGYINTDHKRMRLFDYIISLVEEKMNESNYKEVVKLVENKQSFIYVEAKMFYEIGLNWIPEELNFIHNKMRNMKNCNVETYQKVFGSNMNPTVEQSITAIALYRFQKKQMKDIYQQSPAMEKRKTKSEIKLPISQVVSAM